MIPGIKEHTAAAILVEIGPDMSVFPTGAQLCNWAGICPGNNRSAGKSKASHIKKATVCCHAPGPTVLPGT